MTKRSLKRRVTGADAENTITVTYGDLKITNSGDEWNLYVV